MTAMDADLQQKMSLRGLNFFYGELQALKSVSLPLYANRVTSFIGPSGCGKSTLLRVMNRMYDLYPNQRPKAKSCSMAKTSSGHDRISTFCAPGSAWCSRSRRRFRCRSTTISPSASGSTSGSQIANIDDRVEAALERPRSGPRSKDNLKA